MVECPWCKIAHKRAEQQLQQEHEHQGPAVEAVAAESLASAEVSKNPTSGLYKGKRQLPSWWNAHHLLAASRAALTDPGIVDLSELKGLATVVRAKVNGSAAGRGRGRSGKASRVVSRAVSAAPEDAPYSAAAAAGHGPAGLEGGSRSGRPPRSSAAAATAFLSVAAGSLLGKGAGRDSTSSSHGDTTDSGGEQDVKQPVSPSQQRWRSAATAVRPSSPSLDVKTEQKHGLHVADSGGCGNSREGMYVRIVPLLDDPVAAAAHSATPGMAPNTAVDLIGKSHW